MIFWDVACSLQIWPPRFVVRAATGHAPRSSSGRGPVHFGLPPNGIAARPGAAKRRPMRSQPPCSSRRLGEWAKVVQFGIARAERQRAAMPF
jgi:hypothetical protein